MEQYMTEPKVIRLVGARGKLDWVKINQPEVDPQTGEVKFLNDITASQADFIVDAQDFHQSTRQAMFESMQELVGKLASINVEAALRIMRMALEFSDLPNKDEMASEIKDMLGIVDEQELERMTPEERQAYQKQLAMKQEAAELQRRGAIAALAEQEAKAAKLAADAEKIKADAEKIRAEAAVLLAGGDNTELAEARAEFEQKTREIEERAAAALDQAREQMQDLSQKLANRKYEIDKKAETDERIAAETAKTALERERINAEARAKGAAEVAEINARAKIEEAKIVNKFQKALDGLAAELKELKKTAVAKKPAAKKKP